MVEEQSYRDDEEHCYDNPLWTFQSQPPLVSHTAAVIPTMAAGDVIRPGRPRPACGSSCGRPPRHHVGVATRRSPSRVGGLLELLCVPKFEVDLEFSGGPSESGIVDVAVNVSVDGGQRGT